MTTPPQGDRYADYLSASEVTEHLRRRSIHGAAALAAAQVLRFVLNLGSMVVLARLLLPEDFGLFAMVAYITNFLLLFNDLGLSMATIQRREITHRQVSALFWINLVVTLLLFAINAALAPAIVAFYSEPRLFWVAIGLGAPILLGGLTLQHQALLKRRMQFGTLTLIELASHVAAAVVGIGTAFAGQGYWSLLWMRVGGAAVHTLLVYTICPWRPGLHFWDPEAGAMVRFGGNLTGFNLLNYFARNADYVLIGRVHGTATLGFYEKAYQLLLQPLTQLAGPMGNVAVPALSRLQNDPERYRRYYRRAIQGLVLAGMPLVAFCFASAENLIPLALGPGWDPAVRLFQLLSPAAFISTFSVATGWVFISTGRTDRMLRWGGFVNSPIIVLAFFAGIGWGAEGVAIAYSATVVVLYPITVLYCFRGAPVHLGDLWEALWRPMFCSLAACALAVNLRPFFPADLGHALPVVLVAALFAVVCPLVMLVLPGGRRVISETLDLVREFRRRGN